MIGVKISPLKPFIRGGFDAAAAAYFTAAGITDATQKNAYNTLVVGLKAANLYTKFYALYPMLGGSATSHKFNAINPVDSNAAFRLSFSGGWTHSSNGALPNGTNAYADTFLTPNTTLSLNNTHISFYSRTNISEVKVEFGTQNAASTKRLLFQARIADITYAAVNGGVGAVSFADTDSRGFYIASRIISTTEKLYKNGSLSGTGVLASDGLSTNSLYLGCFNNNGTAGFFSSKQVAFASAGQGFTDSEAATFNTLVTNFQTTLGRNI